MKALFQRLGEWLDERSGWQAALNEALYENIPGGSRWIYVTGSMLVLAFVTQVVTGVFLWMFYSASSHTAYESVYWIQNEISGGWFLRGVHHYMSQMMVVLLPVHLLQVVLCRAYVKPRELNYWSGLVLMLLVLALGLTGYLLPWDQKGYWATKVATELVSLSPIGGGQLQKLAVGGSEYGHYTLTRFFTLHAGVIPGLLVLLLVLHVTLFRRHGITSVSRKIRQDETFWPSQVFKDAAACAAMLLVVVGVVLRHGGAELGPPAEPMQSYDAARPEWFYLFLFQLLKHAPNEFLGAIVIPSGIMLFLFLMPLWAGRYRWTHVVNVVVLLILVVGAIYLTGEALVHDNYADFFKGEEVREPPIRVERIQASQRFQAAKWLAEQEYERVQELVDHFGIPRVGVAAGLVANDPEIQGPRLFGRHCASCHSWLDSEEFGVLGPFPESLDAEETAAPYGAPNLYRFASREWIADVLHHERVAGDDMFGRTIHAEGDMVTFVQDELAELDEEQQQQLDVIVKALSAEAQLSYQAEADHRDRELIEQGVAAFAEAIDGTACLDCHNYQDEGGDAAPDLTGYGSYDWLHAFIANPEHGRFYGENNDRMPAFQQYPDATDKNRLSAKELDLLVRWLRHDDKLLHVSGEQ